MKLQSFVPTQGIRGGVVPTRLPSPQSTTAASVDGFQPSAPTPPLWKKVLNSAVGSVAGTVAGAAVVTAVVAAGQGSGALGAPILGAVIGGPVGLVAGAVAGWKNCGAEKATLTRKLINAASWAVVGAGAGALVSVAVAASGMQGSEALAAFQYAAPGALLGAGSAALAGWNLVGR